MNMTQTATTAIPQDTRKLFFKFGCSGAFFHILNREFGHPSKDAERASAPLCGGLMQTGHQCGMLWGASLAVGAEACRRFDQQDQAVGAAIEATTRVMESFSELAKTPICPEITGCDPSNIFGLLKYFLFVKVATCLNLGVKWAPLAVASAQTGLSQNGQRTAPRALGCASELAKRMGAADEEVVTVAGFSGGLGLSGNACGALGAAIWLKTLARVKTGRSVITNPEVKPTLKAFNRETGSKILCHEICGQRFHSLEEHTRFVREGGCEKLLAVLAQS